MKTRKVTVAVPIVVSEDGKCCGGEKCEFYTAGGCDLAGLDWEYLKQPKSRFLVCRIAEKLMARRMLKAQPKRRKP